MQSVSVQEYSNHVRISKEGKIRNGDHCFKAEFTWKVAFTFSKTPVKTGFRSKSFSPMPFPTLEFWLIISKKDKDSVCVHVCQRFKKLLKTDSEGLQTKVYISVNHYHPFPEIRMLDQETQSAALTVAKNDVQDERFDTRETWSVKCTLCISGMECLKPQTLSENYHRRYAEALANRDLFSSGKGSNIVLKTRDMDYRLHRAILKNGTKSFRNLAGEERIVISGLKSIPKEAMYVVLMYVYTGEFGELREMNSLYVYKAAVVLGLDVLKEACSGVLAKHLCEKTVFQVIGVSFGYRDSNLEMECVRFIAQNFRRIKSTRKWQEFKNSYSSKALKIEKAVKYFECYKNFKFDS